MTQECKTILIIEGSSTKAFALGQLLKQNRFQVLYATDDWDGYQVALACAPDAVILDLELPCFILVVIASRQTAFHYS